jgi:hypothetical protein
LFCAVSRQYAPNLPDVENARKRVDGAEEHLISRLANNRFRLSRESPIYAPAIEAGGLLPKRADDLYRPGTIINDIWKFTQDAKIVLADLTHKNPNVFYELGLAHALAKPAILITEIIEDVPFDLRSLRVLQYDKNRPDWGEKLKNDITNAILEVLKAPMEAILPTFLSVKREAKAPPLSEEGKAIMLLRQEIDALRREVGSRPSI